MATPLNKNERIEGIVVKKTKLAESDLIVAILRKDGSQERAVAKGARKPSSTFASRLELFSHVEILVAKGKNLDIVREAKLINPYVSIRKDVDKVTCVSPVLELLAKATNESLPVPALFPLTISYLNEVDKIGEILYDYLKALTAAHILKTASYLGFRPELTHCVRCGREKKLESIDIPAFFSYSDGGVLCSRCASGDSSISQAALSLAHELIHTKFGEIALLHASPETISKVLEFCKVWVLYHLDINLRSLNLLF